MVGYRTDELPAFWSRESGLAVPLRADEPAEIARAHRARAELGIDGGTLVCQPLPEADAIPRERIEGWMADAMEAAARDGVTGKAVTPALLARMARVSKGETLRANIALIRANARLAAKIALAMATPAAT